MPVRANPVSRTAALLIIATGVFVLFTGLVAGVLANDIAGVSFIVLGLALYGLLMRFTRKLGGEVDAASG